MKKIEASLIKRLLRISGKGLVTVRLGHFSFGGTLFYSLSYSLILKVFLEHSWRSVAYLEFWNKKAKEKH